MHKLHTTADIAYPVNTLSDSFIWHYVWWKRSTRI